MGLFGFGKKKKQKTEPEIKTTTEQHDCSYLKNRKDIQSKESTDSNSQEYTKPTQINSLQVAQLAQLAQQALESIDIMSKTHNPETFFSRCKFFNVRVLQIEQLENQINYSIPEGDSAALRSYFNEYFPTFLTNCFNDYQCEAYLTLKSDKAIQNRIDKFWEIAGEYTPNVQTLKDMTEDYYADNFEDEKYKKHIEEVDKKAHETSDKYYNEWVDLLNQFDPFQINHSTDNSFVPGSVELSFLKYMNKKTVKNPQVAQYWRIEYRINFKALMTEFITHRYLRISSPYDVLPKLKVDELRKILEEQGLEKKGTKAVLIERIKDSLPEDAISHLLPKDKAFYVLTEKGVHATEDLKTSATKDIDMEDFCINEILNGNFDEAYRRICEWEASKLIFRGVGIDWNHELKYGLSKTKAVTYRNFFEADLDELPDALKYHENIFKACVILGDILGVSIDKTYSLFRRLSDTEEEKYIIIEQLQNYSLNLQSYKPHTVSYWD